MRKAIVYMKSISFTAIIIALFALMIVKLGAGCGPGKELPDELPVRKEPVIGPREPEPKVPDTSDADAKALAEKAIDAITQNDRRLLEKAKVCRVTGQGTFQFEDKVAATRYVQTVWPDKARATYEFKDGIHPRITFAMNGSFGWRLFEPAPYTPSSNPLEISELLKNDFSAEHWIPLGLTLAEPGNVCFDLKKTKTAKGEAASIKIRVKGRPLYQVTFDDKTNLPLRIEYSAVEFGANLKKVVTVSEHKVVEGLMLPSYLESNQNEVVRYSWNLENWEFPEKLDESLFNPPVISQPKQ
jgi:hypothetical protein